MWKKTSEHTPVNNTKVKTKIDDKDGCRNEQNLIYQDGLWFLTDMSMYVYYEPTHWDFV